MSRSWDESDIARVEEVFGGSEPADPWSADGWAYRSCHRCGINMRLPADRASALREYCRDCNYPDLRAPFDGTLPDADLQTRKKGVR